ncbi:PCRF domain-containing protein [Pseudoxanthomonas mexicana]
MGQSPPCSPPTSCGCICQYAASKGWKTELLERNESDLGGFKSVQVAIKGSSSTPRRACGRA